MGGDEDEENEIAKIEIIICRCVSTFGVYTPGGFNLKIMNERMNGWLAVLFFMKTSKSVFFLYCRCVKSFFY